MDEALVKQRVATATLRLAARFERFVHENQALLTDETSEQLRQVIGDLRSTAALLGVDAEKHSPSDIHVLGDALESFAGEFADKQEYLRKVSELAAHSYDAAQAG